MSYQRKLILLPATDKSLYVTELGRSFADEPRSARQQIRTYYIIHFITRGVLRISGKEVKAGEALLLPEGVQYAFSFDADFDHFWIGFGGEGAKSLLQALSIPTSRHSVFGLNGFDGLGEALEELLIRLEKTRDGTDALSLLMSVLPRLEIYKNHATPSHAERARIFMDNNYGHDITMDAVAKSVGISEKHLCRLFRNEFGTTPKEYLTDRRMQIARELINSTDMLIKEIAYCVGFSSPLAFSAAYKRYWSVYPTFDSPKDISRENEPTRK